MTPDSLSKLRTRPSLARIPDMRFKHVLRRLLHSPMFTAITVITLAVGIGANSAIFTVIEGILLKPLPYPHSEELIAVSHAAPGVSFTDTGSAPFLNTTYRQEGRAFRGVGLWREDIGTVTGLAAPEEIACVDVTESILPILGVEPILGRRFSQKDDAPGSPRTAILTYGYWQSRFGGQASVIGRTIVLDGLPREVIGVMPAAFRFLDASPALILPLRLDESKMLLGNFSYRSIARLKPGSTIEQARADVTRMIPIALQKFPPPPGYSLKMFEEARLGPNLRFLKQDLVGDIGKTLWVLMATIGMVLLIACANVANLLLVRADGRQHELAIRAALGASWGQIARALLLESVTLGLFGGALGLAFAFGGLRLLVAMAPAHLPRLADISIDPVVLLFTLAVSLLAGLLFGLVPVIKFAGTRVASTLRAGGRTLSESRERHRARSILVIVQVALALVLLVSSGLMIRTFQALKRVQPGFSRPGEVLTLRISIPETQVRDAVALVRMEQDILDRIGAIPGVSSAGLTSAVSMDGNGWRDPIYAEDHVYSEGRLPPLRRFKFISPGLLNTMGNRLIAGREFTWQDVYAKRPIAMVSENLAREMWRNPAAALGKRIRESTKSTWREVIGVVSDEREDGVDHEAPAIAIFPTLMDDFEGNRPFIRRTLAYVVRSGRTGSQGFLKDIQQAVWSVNPNLPLADVRTLQSIYEKSMARTSFTLVMLAIAGGMALLIGLVGIYGVISYSVSQRTREIGIRAALGARRVELTRMFVAHGLILAAIGVVFGLAAAAALSQLIKTLLFEVSPLDPITYAAVSAGLIVSAILASYIPAMRATTVDPVEALRAE
jgi:putative ABC transport system permease protein